MTNVLKAPYPDAAAPPPAIITSGLIFALAMSEGSGQTIAAAHGTSYSAVLGSTSSAEGNDPDWVTGGLNFVLATADVVTAAGVPDTGWLGALTVTAVAKVNAGTARGVFAVKQPISGSVNIPCMFESGAAASPVLILTRAPGATGSRTHTGPTIARNTFHCVSVVCGSTVETLPTFYVNTTPTTGTLFAGTVTGAPTGTSQPVLIGRRADFSTQMEGTMCYVLVYNRALSAAEIGQNYDALKAIMALRGVSLP